MEEKKELKNFGVFEIPKDQGELSMTPVIKRSRGSTGDVTPNNNIINVNIGKGVILHLDEEVSKLIHFQKGIILIYNEVIQLDDLYPDLIVGFTPPLFKEFIVKGKLLNHIQIGSEVKINPRYKDNRIKSYRLKDVYFKSLNDMTVLVALLDDGDIVLYNRLQLCK